MPYMVSCGGFVLLFFGVVAVVFFSPLKKALLQTAESCCNLRHDDFSEFES